MEMRIGLSTPADDAAIRGLLRRESMPGRITLGYEREPDFALGCRVTGDDCRVLVARAGAHDDVVGVACRSTRRLYVNGRERRLGYIGQLRVDERFRGRWIVSKGFSALKRLDGADPLPAYLSAIVDGNREALGVLVRKPRKHFPAFREVARYRTLAIPVRRRKPPLSCHARVAAASERDLSEIAAFLRAQGARRQFFPVWTEESLGALTALGLPIDDLRVARSGDGIVGLAGLWDQSGYKQTVVRGYSGWLRAAAPLLHIGAPWFGRTGLPKPGQRIRSAYAAFICIADDDAGIFAALLRELYTLAGSRAFDYLLVGLDARDPLAPVARDYAHVLYPSRLYLAEWPDGGRLHEQLDDRPAYVDIATL